MYILYKTIKVARSHHFNIYRIDYTNLAPPTKNTCIIFKKKKDFLIFYTCMEMPCLEMVIYSTNTNSVGHHFHTWHFHSSGGRPTQIIQTQSIILVHLLIHYSTLLFAFIVSDIIIIYLYTMPSFNLIYHLLAYFLFFFFHILKS